MPYPIYKLIHFLGIFTVLTVFASAAWHVVRGGTRADNPHRKLLGALHGVGLFLVLLGGFGMLARLGVLHGSLPMWIYLKLGIWVLVGAAMSFVYRGAAVARALMLAVPLLAVIAAAIALYKP